MTSVGDRLKSLRKERRLFQEEVAYAVGIARSYLSRLETEKDHAGKILLMKLADYYDVSLDWLTTGAGTPPVRSVSTQTRDEALLLSAYRRLPEPEAKHLLLMLRARVQSMTPSSDNLEQTHGATRAPAFDA
jgi:transcriptional regulator with XRE-family HTH domain